MSHSIQTQNSYGPYNASSITHDTESDPHWSWFISGTKTNSVTDSPTLNALLMNLVFSLYFLIQITFKLAWILHVPKLGSSESGKSRQANSAGIKVTQVVDDCMCIAYLPSESDSTQVVIL